jgi:tetratricopeptide (TPR) repeat protein
MAILVGLLLLSQDAPPAAEEQAPPPPLPEVAQIVEIYDRLGEEARKDPSRWDLFFQRGLLKCRQIVFTMRQLDDTINLLRARGTNDEVLQAIRLQGHEVRESELQVAYRDFRLMEEALRRLGRTDPDRTLFASACLKFAREEYLKTASGEPGAIEDFRSLLPRRFEPEACRAQLFYCYLQLGIEAYEASDYPKAQAHWDEALRWAPDARHRELVRSNKAAAYEMDNAFGSAEDLLRKQLEEQPDEAIHWKNLGLVLGYQGRLREALLAYGKARDLCRAVGNTPIFPGVFHGNAWLRAAMIHGKLLEEDGDLLEAWRLFLEYRKMLGDDYNFCLAFGDFAANLGAYPVAMKFLERARDLQPHCPNPHLLLVQAAARRTDGTPEERRLRLEKASQDRNASQERYQARAETAGLRRICGGLHDLADAVVATGKVEQMSPDPLEGYGPDRVPEWIAEAAKGRKPFRPFDPLLDAPKDASPGASPNAPAPAPRKGGGVAFPWFVAAGTAFVALALLLFRRRRPS